MKKYQEMDEHTSKKRKRNDGTVEEQKEAMAEGVTIMAMEKSVEMVQQLPDAFFEKKISKEERMLIIIKMLLEQYSTVMDSDSMDCFLRLLVQEANLQLEK